MRRNAADAPESRVTPLSYWTDAAAGYAAAAEGYPSEDEAAEGVSAGDENEIAVTPFAVEQQIVAAKADRSLDEQTRTTVVGTLERSLESLRTAESTQHQAAQVGAQIRAIPQQVRELESNLQDPATRPPAPDWSRLSLEQAQGQHAAIVKALQKARETLQANLQHATHLTELRRHAESLSAELIRKQTELQMLWETMPQANVASIVTSARLAEFAARHASLAAEERLLQAQLHYAEASVDLQPLQHDWDRREVARLEAIEHVWEQALAHKRDMEAERQIEDARRKTQETAPALAHLATENQQLAESRVQFAAKLDKVTHELREIREAFATEEQAFQKIRDRVEKVGMTEAIGQLLRTHQRRLLNDRPLWARAQEIEGELPQIELMASQTDEKRKAMWDLDQLVWQQARKLLPDHDEQVAHDMVYELLAAQRQYLTSLNADLQAYQTNLTDLHTQLRKTAALTVAHRSYIREHILWIRSGNIVSWQDIVASQQALAELLDPAHWIRVWKDVGSHLRHHLGVWLVLSVVFGVGWSLNGKLRRRIDDLGKTKAVSTGSRFLPTAEVAAESAWLACFLPGTVLLVSLYLTRFPQASLLEVAIGGGLYWTSLMWLGLSLLQQVCRAGGLAEAHFGWHPRNVAVIRHNLRLLITAGLPAVFVVMIIGSFREGDYVASLGRLSFMGGMSVMALFAHRLLDPYRTTNGIWANPNVWLYRIRHLVHAVGVLIPAALTTLAAWGYVYSAHQLAYRAQLSLWLVMGVVLSQTLLGRYLQIARRNAAMRHMQRRRSELAEQPESELPAEADIDFRSIGSQVRRLLRGGTVVAMLVGMSLIWADMVPALKFLDHVELWRIEVVGAELDGIPLQRWITLGDVLLAASALLATIMAARNVPGLLNITVFERLPVDYGTRYALTAVSRYLISLVGLIVAFQFVGITWRSVQWLVAAMTVGLGFGLQEIFANFVSGLIVFTERPVRVGDIVTVGTVTGKVTRIQIRATTITDFDRRELVVPNKRFITEDVINWTLSDPITRVILPVGISYDCDPNEARKQLLSVAHAHPLVLDEPESTAVFVGFGESTLDFELRVFLVGRDNVSLVQNELNLAIHRAFQQANLEIAYPQRDLHIRSITAEAIADSAKHTPYPRVFTKEAG